MEDQEFEQGRPKVGVFLDTENLTQWLSRQGAQSLLGIARGYGVVVVRRAYGDWSRLRSHQERLNRQGFEFVHTYHPAKGKNSADIQMVVDVMDYVARLPDLHTVILATGDSDFSPLFRRLRELGRCVVGVGYDSPLSRSVKTSCSRFHVLPKVTTVKRGNGQTPRQSSAQLRPEEEQQLLRGLASELLARCIPNGQLSAGALKKLMIETDPSFDESSLGYEGFLAFVRAHSELAQVQRKGTTWWISRTEPKARSFQGKGAAKDLTKTYLALLKSKGWRSPKREDLLSVASFIRERWGTESFDPKQARSLYKARAQGRTPSGWSKAWTVLYKAKVIRRSRRTHGCHFPQITEEEILFQIDLALLSRLLLACEENDVLLHGSQLEEILIGDSTPARVEALFSELVGKEEADQGKHAFSYPTNDEQAGHDSPEVARNASAEEAFDSGDLLRSEWDFESSEEFESEEGTAREEAAGFEEGPDDDYDDYGDEYEDLGLEDLDDSEDSD